MNLDNLLWLLPTLFIIHDFEEILLIKSWKRKNQDLFHTPIGFKPYEGFLSTESFSAAVLEELLIFIGVVVYSLYTYNYLVWIGTFFALLIHFVPHILFCIRAKRFVPGALTAIIMLPFSIQILIKVIQVRDYQLIEIILSCLLCVTLFIINLKFLHRLFPKLNQWLS
ncbi:MAG: HXXEE domain-containing protein [Clostridiales bacterium]|nr:HXXEE domain-containing protein [Clostridiales bacterium]